MLTVFECLEIIRGTFLLGETKNEGLVILHPSVWREKDKYVLCDGEEWKKTKGFYYRWYDGGFDCLTNNDWQGPFGSKQEAFDSAQEMYGSDNYNDIFDDSDDEEESAWRRYADVHGLEFKN